MSLSTARIALLEREVLEGIRLHNAAASIEGRTYRAYQRAMRDRTSPDFHEATMAYHQANLLADSYRRALAQLTNELGYVPKPGGGPRIPLSPNRSEVPA